VVANLVLVHLDPHEGWEGPGDEIFDRLRIADGLVGFLKVLLDLLRLDGVMRENRASGLGQFLGAFELVGDLQLQVPGSRAFHELEFVL
jgi:hypothetical protein